jgi:hypothetical protein
MKLNANLFRAVLGKAALATLALGGFFFGVAPKASADPWPPYDRPVVVYSHPYFRPGYVAVRPYYRRDYDDWAFRRHQAFERREHVYRSFDRDDYGRRDWR